MGYHIRNRKPTKPIQVLPSPTYSVESHDLWAAAEAWALSQVNEISPPNACGTLVFPNCAKSIISKFTCSLSRSVRYRNSKVIKGTQNECTWGELGHMAMYGVFEIREEDALIHMHFLARCYDHEHLEGFIDRFNKKHGTSIDVPFIEAPKDVESISVYPFKFGREFKVLFQPLTLARYVYQCGQYFFSNKKEFKKDGFLEFSVNRLNQKFQNLEETIFDEKSEKTTEEIKPSTETLDLPEKSLVRDMTNSCRSLFAKNSLWDLIQLPVDQRDHSEDVEGILLGHVPFRLGRMCQRVTDRAIKAVKEVYKAGLLALFGFGQKIVDFQKRAPVLLGKSTVD